MLLIVLMLWKVTFTFRLLVDVASNHTELDQYDYVSLYVLNVVNRWGQYEPYESPA